MGVTKVRICLIIPVIQLDNTFFIGDQGALNYSFCLKVSL